MSEPFKSVIPKWCADIAAHVVADYGSDPSLEEITAGRLRAKQSGRYIIVTEQDAQAWLNRLPDADRAA
jgi:hypothetical protein